MSSVPHPGLLRSPTSYSMMVLLVDDQAIVAETVRRCLANLPDMDFHFCADPNRAVWTVSICSSNIGRTLRLKTCR
jgi:two-component system, chemotaxis family, response regulator WspR